MKYLILFTLLFLTFQATSANEVVAITEAVRIEDTGISSASICQENGECYTWRTFYLFEVKMKRILKGLETDKTISFLYSAHSLNVSDMMVVFKNSLVRLVEIKDRVEAIKNIPAKYMLFDWEIPQSKECFSNEFSPEVDFDGSMYINGQKIRCFDKEILDRLLYEKAEY
ncbi:MAG: hypothetical protein AAF431_12370 [Pseudomonadota bacterium]